jgi:uncharacterized protein YoxC
LRLNTQKILIIALTILSVSTIYFSINLERENKTLKLRSLKQNHLIRNLKNTVSVLEDEKSNLEDKVNDLEGRIDDLENREIIVTYN